MSTKVQNYLKGKDYLETKPRAALSLWGPECEGEQCLIRINDFPDDHLYTLIVNDREVAHFDDWPLCWTRP